MPNVAKLLREEITRLARKEVKGAVLDLKKDAVKNRKAVGALNKRISSIEKMSRRMIVTIENAKRAAVVEAAAPSPRMRFTSRTSLALRRKLKLSQVEFGRLIGLSGQSVYQWERKGGRIKLRKKTLEALAAIKSIGAREARKRLGVEMKSKSAPKKSKTARKKTK